MARCLSFHASYQCGRSGACCTAAWPIPVEPAQLRRLRRAVAAGTLTPAGERAAQSEWAVASGDGPDGSPTLLAVSKGQCVFLEAVDGHRCQIHHALGHAALPLACRQFPRMTVLDPRGASVALSAFCPTAARMLTRAQPVSIVDSPPAFPENGEYVGLDARAGWPPILRPGVLMDWPAWWEFERRAVDLIGNVAKTPEDAMARVGLAVELTRGWMVDDGPLLAQVGRAFDAARADAHVDRKLSDDRGRWGEIAATVERSIPPRLAPPPPADPTHREPADRALAFLASHAFANWAIHLGEDLRAWLRSVETAYALLVAGCTVREADLRLRHLCPTPPPRR